jgi:hypothetical protein
LLKMPNHRPTQAGQINAQGARIKSWPPVLIQDLNGRA